MKIVSDSSSNITSLEDVHFASVPIRVLTDKKEYVDDSEAGVAVMVEELAAYKGKSRTSCPAPGDWIEAKQQYEDENPGKKVFVIDSLSAGPEIGLTIYKLRELILEGKDFKTISKEIMEYKEKTMLSFSLENLANLANNGRVNPAVAKIVGFVGIRLVGRASIEGTLQPTDKSRGEKKALITIMNNMKKHGYIGGKVLIDHCQNPDAATELKTMLQAEFPDADVNIGTNKALCSFYAEKGGVLVGYEVKDVKPA